MQFKLFFIKMKKTIFLAAILIAALGFTGCGGSDKNGGDLKINAKVSHGDLVNDQVTEVRAKGWACIGKYPVDENDDDIIDWYECTDLQEVTIASAPFKNGGFKMTLPEKIDERLLEDITAFPDYMGTIPAEINISDKNVKGTIVVAFLAFKNNLWVGDFRCIYFSNDHDTEAFLFYSFVDGDCKVSGTVTRTYGPITSKDIFDLDLKKGWNAVYQIQTVAGNTNTVKVTTKKPDFDLTWYFVGGGVLHAPSKDAKPFK